MFGLFKGFRMTLKYFFKPKVTIMYPEERPVIPERFRGVQRIRVDKCINCNMCVNICPTEAITLKGERDPETKKPKLLAYDINFERCMRCELCTEVCPTGALVFTTLYENLAVYDRKALAKDINWVSGNHRYGNYYDEVEEGRPEGLPTSIVPPAPPAPKPTPVSAAGTGAVAAKAPVKEAAQEAKQEAAQAENSGGES